MTETDRDIMLRALRLAICQREDMLIYMARKLSPTTVSISKADVQRDLREFRALEKKLKPVGVVS